MARTTPMRPADAEARLQQAVEFERMATHASEAGLDNAAAANAVLASVAASDAICGARLRVRSTSVNHADAVELLRQVDGHLANTLKRLLSEKTRADYDPEPVSRSTSETAIKQARRLVAAAEHHVRGAPQL